MLFSWHNKISIPFSRVVDPDLILYFYFSFYPAVLKNTGECEDLFFIVNPGFSRAEVPCNLFFSGSCSHKEISV